jgi:hypothetical protein
MHIARHNPHTYDYSRLLSAIAGTDACDNLSLNPCLPLITAETMDWRSVSLLFLASEVPVAWFAAIHTGSEWFSLPHYNNGAYWYNTSGENPLNSSTKAKKWDAQMFFSHYISGSKWFVTPPEKSSLFVVELGNAGLAVPEDAQNKEFSLKVRSYNQLSEYFLSHKVDSQLNLHPEPELQLKALPQSVRRKILKAERSNIIIRSGGAELMDTFYAVYRKRIHELGSFALPRSFFEHLLLKYSNGEIRLLTAEYRGKIVGSAVLMTFGRYAENPWFATLAEGNKVYVSYLLHHHMMLFAAEQGCKVYSFGYSTRNSGVHKYKQQWGTIDRTIYLSGNKPVLDNRSGKQYLRSLIRHLPILVSKTFDKYIARRYY